MHPAFRVGEEAISVSLKLHESDAMTLAGTPIERIVIEIGRTAVLLRTSDHKLAKMLLDRYNGFVTPAENVAAEFEIESHDGGPISSEQEVSVRWKNDQWIIERGDFRVRWSPRRRAGTIRQAASPFATDSALRIVHSLVLASEGGFLLHAASAIRNGRAFLFAGASGAGKTTMRFLISGARAIPIERMGRRSPGNWDAMARTFLRRWKSCFSWCKLRAMEKPV
jgi:hypothetical protein